MATMSTSTSHSASASVGTFTVCGPLQPVEPPCVPPAHPFVDAPPLLFAGGLLVPDPWAEAMTEPQTSANVSTNGPILLVMVCTSKKILGPKRANLEQSYVRLRTKFVSGQVLA